MSVFEAFWSVFPPFGLNTERYSIYPCIQFEYGKTQTRKTPYRKIFHAVFIYSKKCYLLKICRENLFKMTLKIACVLFHCNHIAAFWFCFHIFFLSTFQPNYQCLFLNFDGDVRYHKIKLNMWLPTVFYVLFHVKSFCDVFHGKIWPWGNSYYSFYIIYSFWLKICICFCNFNFQNW